MNLTKVLRLWRIEVGLRGVKLIELSEFCQTAGNRREQFFASQQDQESLNSAETQFLD